MRKYWAVCRANVLNTLTYRVPIIIWNIGDLLSLATIVAVWLSASADRTIGEYTKAELILYYIIVLFLQWIVYWHPFYGVKEEIRDGTISFWLTKPASYFWSNFSKEIGWHIVSSIAGLLTTSAVVLLLRINFSLNLLELRAPFFIIAILLACIICFTISLCLALLCFWLMEVDGINSLYFILIFIFGGQGIPLSFFPSSFRWLVEVLPFRYLFSFPLEIYFGKVWGGELVKAFLVGCIWVFILVSTYKFMWRRGLKKFSAFGN